MFRVHHFPITKSILGAILAMPWSGALGADWTPHPTLHKTPQGRTQLRLQLTGMQARTLELFSPGVGREPLIHSFHVPLTQPEAVVQPRDGIGNYYWIMARETAPDEEQVIATAHHFAIPGPSPHKMLQVAKSRLSLTPSPLPREHAAYRSGERWSFQVRFDHQPLPGQPVTLYAPGYDASPFLTDASGLVQVTLPPFPESSEQYVDHRTGQPDPRRRSVPFQVATVLRRDGQRFTTIFQSGFGPHPLFNKDPGWGAAALLTGMGGALPLWRWRRRHPRLPRPGRATP